MAGTWGSYSWGEAAWAGTVVDGPAFVAASSYALEGLPATIAAGYATPILVTPVPAGSDMGGAAIVLTATNADVRPGSIIVAADPIVVYVTPRAPGDGVVTADAGDYGIATARFTAADPARPPWWSRCTR